jgi:hypothetical protein
MTRAGEALRSAAAEALRSIPGVAVYDAPPVQAATPFVVVEAGPEADWSHNTGTGRELRLAVTVHDRGERPPRLDSLMEEGEAVLAGLGASAVGWQLVTFRFLRSRVAPPQAGAPNGLWTGLLEYRARMLAD